MADEYETSMSVPLDSDGFLRRQCPTCERELKWLGEEDGEEPLEPPEGGYYCAYCAIQAPAGEWWTEAQAALARSIILKEVVDPELDRFERNVRDLSRGTGGLISASVSRDRPQPVDPLTESDDMRRVDFPCHPGASVKVLDDWARDVHCPICGTAVAPA